MSEEYLDTVLGNARYAVQSRLGAGAHGIVYRAMDTELQRQVAIKTLRSQDPESLFRLKREFRSLASIRHTNLAALYELEVQDDVFLAMEYIDGADLLATLEPMSSERRITAIRHFLPQILEGLAFLHSKDKLHRDIKPGNVLVEDERVVLVDFGMATGLDSRASMMSIHTGMAGTLAYMAPEQISATGLSSATDVFSVGVLLYECLCGRLPRETVPEILDPRIEPPDPVALNPDLPQDLCDLAMAMMSTDPAQRPSVAEALALLGSAPPAPAPVPINDVLVGRRNELGRFHAALDLVHRGQSASIAVRGPSGIGKSTLLETFLDRVEERDEALVFRSRCQPWQYVRYEAMDGLVDEISRFLSHLGDEQVQGYLPRHMGALTRVFPVLGRVLRQQQRRQSFEDTDERELRRLAFEALRQLIGRIGDRKATILWIDDLQWGDIDSANLIREILREPDAPPVMFIFSYRSGEIDSPIMQDLLSSDSGAWRDIENIDVLPLELPEAEALLSELTGRSDWPAQVHDLLAEAEGSPFMIGELARSILAADTEPNTELGALRLDGLVQQRLRSLPPDLFKLLSYIAFNEGPIRRSIVFSACTVGAAAADSSALLEQQNLIKTVNLAGEVAFDTYHDRFRAAMIECTGSDQQVQVHSNILDALEAEALAGPEVMAFHALRAERTDSLVHYSVEAAETAEAGLAFALAADLYSQALEHGSLQDNERATLLEKSGKAAALAGSGATAAQQLQAAAELLAQLQSPRVAHLQAAAAEQYFASGYLEEGHGLLKPLMASRNIAFPESTGAAMLRMAPTALALRLFGTQPAKTAKAVDGDALSDIELLWSAAKGLGAMDSLRASYFNCLGLKRAVASGDRSATTRFLCGFAGSTLVPAGGGLKRWGLDLLQRAGELAQELEDPALIGLVTVIKGQTSLQSGQWKQALEQSDSGLAHLQEHASGVAWECDLAVMGAIRALEELGDYRQMYARSEQLLLQAEAIADKYAVAVARGYRMIARIPADQLDLAEEDAQFLSEKSSSSTSDQLHSIYAVRGLAMIALARGEFEDAWDLVESLWPKLKSSGLLFAQIIRIDMWALRGRIAAATLGTAPKRASIAKQAIKILRQEGRTDASAWSTLLQGLIEEAGSQSQLGAFADAAQDFDSANQTGMAALCRYRRALIAQDNDAVALESETLADCGVVATHRWAAAMAPLPAKTG